MKHMLVPIHEIKVNSGRRMVDTEYVQELAYSIQEVGLLNPITLDKEKTLIAGLHRLEAVKLLEWTEIESTISSLEGLKAELAEIDENFVRCDLSTLEFADLLSRRKEIYEALHPETKAGVAQAIGMNRALGNNVSEKFSPTSKSFVRDTSEKLGLTPRSIEVQIQTAKNLTPQAKEIILKSNTKIKKITAHKLSRLAPEQQEEAAAMLASGQIRSVEQYQALKAKEDSHDICKQDSTDNLMTSNDNETAEVEGMAHVGTTKHTMAPYHLPDKHFNSFAESVADLKDPNKDCSCTPDIFLAEFSGFVRKFIKEIQWYTTPHYEIVFPALTEEQLAYLRGQTDTICSAAGELLQKVERNSSA